jgi:predicted RNA methylase
MFGKDFYPTPDNVIEIMMANTDITGKVILEPSAGKGNIVDWLLQNGATTVLACEIEDNLRKIISSKCHVLEADFFNVRQENISHIDMIVMNPPFSADEKHILHAWEIAPGGCEIIALCNSETLNNKYSRNRAVLQELIEMNGSSTSLYDCFTEAERETGVHVSLVRLYKPATGEMEFDGYFEMQEEEEHQENGIMTYNSIQEVVSRYVGAVKMFDDVVNASDTMNSLINPISDGLGIHFGAYTGSHGNQYNVITRDVFKKALQKSAWRSVFHKFNMNKYVTQKLMGDINKFVEQQTAVPFTVKNIFKMIDLIIGTHAERMDSVLVEAFDKICSFSSENSTAGEKWKTNSNYKVNQKFIVPYMCRNDTRWPSQYVDMSYSRDHELDDIVKALCYLTGKDYNITTSINSFVRSFNMEWGQWYEWGFFEIRGYKKGTMHFKFQSIKLWEDFNRKVGEIKGWQLPRKTDNKTKGTERTKSTQVEVFEF